jgi:hypothetical protein
MSVWSQSTAETTSHTFHVIVSAQTLVIQLAIVKN